MSSPPHELLITKTHKISAILLIKLIVVIFIIVLELLSVGEGVEGDFAVVEMVAYAFYFLISLVSFSGD